jgi:hypothetical protein
MGSLTRIHDGTACAADLTAGHSSIELLDELDQISTLRWQIFKVLPEYDPVDHDRMWSGVWVD